MARLGDDGEFRLLGRTLEPSTSCSSTRLLGDQLTHPPLQVGRPVPEVPTDLHARRAGAHVSPSIQSCDRYTQDLGDLRRSQEFLGGQRDSRLDHHRLRSAGWGFELSGNRLVFHS